MKADGGIDSQPPRPFHSLIWDVYVPATIVALPAGIFALLGLITAGFDKPGTELPIWVIVVMLVLQTSGMVALAVLILVRFGLAMDQLTRSTLGRPPFWRRMFLMLSIAALLLFDILSSVGTAFAGGELLLVAALPMFAVYFCLRLIAFAGLSPGEPERR